MVLPKLLLVQQERSKKAARTTPPLRKRILRAVHDQLSATYGENYSNRCVQSSVLCRELLNYSGIRASLVKGSVVVLQAFPHGKEPITWGSFEDHCWVYTEFGELVDSQYASSILQKA
jgi:hypothetical protein